MSDKEKQVIFAIAPAHARPDGVPVLVFMMPPKSWKYMEGGLGHDFDLTKVGVPLKVIIGRCKSHDDGMKTLQQFIGGVETVDVRHIDLKFEENSEPDD